MARWLRIDADLAYNRKTERMMASLGCSRLEAVGILTSFLSLMRREKPDGVMDGVTEEDIDRVGERVGVLAALRSCGFVEEGPDGLMVHDWEAMQGGFLKDADRHRKKRIESKAVLGASADGPRSIMGSRARADGTGRDETGQEEESKAAGYQENVKHEGKPAAFAASLFGSVSPAKHRWEGGSRAEAVTEVWKLIEGEPEEVQRTCMAVVGKLLKAGEKSGVARACIEHYLAHRETIQSPYAYYAAGGEGLAWVKQRSRLAAVDRDWAAEKKAAAEAAS
jgi:hypothetical protein